MYEPITCEQLAQERKNRYAHAADILVTTRHWGTALAENGYLIGYDDAIRAIFGQETLDHLDSLPSVYRQVSRFTQLFNAIKAAR